MLWSPFRSGTVYFKQGLSPPSSGSASRVEVPVSSLEGGRVRSGRRLPFQPLTEPREVVACAGNILRDLTISEGGTMPASRELEIAVGRYFRDRGRRQEKVDVFAYITLQKPSAENEGEIDPWDTQKGETTKSARGWRGMGAKVGLLSLDPQGEYDPDRDGGEFKRGLEKRLFGGKDDVVDARGVEEQREKRRHPEAVVEVGDWVRFYIVEGQRAGEAGDDVGGGKVVFGCVSREGEIVGHGEESWETTNTTRRPFG
ncbi:hypothetical protein BDZ91DRAFT_768527 [Kalaharituber pfeilii]|nr:hypothetical protein BDZ91DRAFT_768527 [Kalaharituber pfeilii]